MNLIPTNGKNIKINPFYGLIYISIRHNLINIP